MSTILTSIEPCPVCQHPEMEIEHGFIDGRGLTIHIEHCPECGEHSPIVCYDCELCIQAQGRKGAKDETPNHLPEK